MVPAREQVGQQLVGLGDPRSELFAVDEDRAAAELQQLHRRADRRSHLQALRAQRACELVPRRVGRGLGIEPPGEDAGEVAQGQEQHVVEALDARRLERNVGGPVGSVLIAHPPLGLGQVHGGSGHVQHPAGAKLGRHGAAQPFERLRVAPLEQQRVPVPGIDRRAEEARRGA